ncbi:hypothetical protein GQ42DRAFT_79112 [Ramicandelaber brevisporus]|nr:hypothetical protein GQ42DRAFT_85550 [Ramicandelaber brevisporus]KAI8866157.1 hypothetical protein GQ42DRAFT_79112 [Ramicandelaber brevisporus]
MLLLLELGLWFEWRSLRAIVVQSDIVSPERRFGGEGVVVQRVQEDGAIRWFMSVFPLLSRWSLAIFQVSNWSV